MAYALRYYKELIHEDGSVHRLEIHKKDSTAEAVEIGAVIQGLALEIQGSQGDVDSPIVKTSLSMTFVDAGDIEDGRKNGFWQEFYTPDALLWKVILKARTATETSFRTMWGGYVTPDSFSESLVYRGSVNIIARDNLGHMQDFPFDAVGDAGGLISLRNLVEAGWEKIQSPMVLDWRGETESNMWLMCDGVPAPDTLMNVSQFEGMDWYKAIETALASYGIVMRWVGDNIVNVSSLRSMPLQGREVMDNLSQITPVFVAGAQRELVPAVRRIEESVSYDLQETLSMPKLDSSAFTGDTQSYRCKIDGVDIGYGQFGTLEHDAPIWPINPNNGWSDEDDATTLFFNPKAYELGTFASRRGLGDEIYRYMYIAANNVDDRRVSFTRSITCADVTISMKLGQPCNLDILNKIEQQSVFNLKRITFAVILEQGGVTRYYNGWSWGASYAEISVDYDPTSPSYEFSQFVSMGDNAGAAELTFCIVKIEYAQTSYVGNSSVYGLYACIQDLSFNIPESSSLLSDNSVNTVYNAENNVVLSRTPEIGPAYNAVALPGLIKNGIFYRSGDVILPARKWGWSGSTPQQMAVYNHLQLLCYYAKPNNLIRGTIVNGDLTSGRAIYLWHGKEHLLVSGRYNLLNGMIEGAMLREFTRYEAMWGEVSETAFPDTEQDSTTNVEGGASSGGSSSTYTNTTTVNIGSGGGGGASYLNDLMDVNTDSVTAQSVLYYNGTEWVGRSLSTILNGYAKSADLRTLSNLLASMWSIDDDGNLVTDKQVIIKNNLVVHGDQTAGGEGGGSSSVGIQGIVVNGTTYRDTNGDGLIDLGTIGGGTITEITSEMITEALGYVPYSASNPNGYITASALGGYATQLWVEGKGYAVASSLGSLATKDSVAWSEITDVLTGGDEFNIIPSGHNGVFSFNHRAKDGGSGTITEYRMRNGGGSYAPVRALSFIAHGGTSSQFLKADGSLDSTSYLSTAGGTISGSLIVQASSPAVTFKKSNASYPFASLGIYSDKLAMYVNSEAKYYDIYHSGNFNPANYLPLSGGTLTGDIVTTGDITTKSFWSGTDGSGLYIEGKSNVGIRIQYNKSTTGRDYDQLRLTNGVISWNDNTLLHSGNVSEYALKTDGSNVMTGGINWNNVGTNVDAYGEGLIVGRTTDSGTTLDVLGSKYASVLNVSNGAYRFQIASSASDVNRLFYRGYDANQYSYFDWKTIAFTDSTVASAYKLVTSAGADSVVPNANGYTYVYGDLWVWAQDASDRVVRLRNDPSDLYTRLKADGSGEIFVSGNYALKFGTANTARMVINSSGNVTIGDSDLAATISKCKLYVDGRVHSSRAYLFNGEYGIWRAEQFTGNIPDTGMVYNATTHAFVGGNVLIGTTNDSGSKLFVNGVTRASAFRSTNIGIECDADGNTTGYGSEINRFGSNLYLQGREGNLYLSHSAGTTYIRGLASITGAVTMASTLSVTGASTFNGNTTISGSVGISSTDANIISMKRASEKRKIFIRHASNTFYLLTSDENSDGFNSLRPFILKLDTGYIGINKASPSRQLDVVGTFRATGSVELGSTTINGNLVVTGDISA